ncbi:hypothetical protein HK097_007127 [Rhizophlyctis rosea]|uniref:Uncharacterized protein n=1 Tax=Rhizophlyctis rosea TaxID=64517 RepID=A0AAD5SKJ7_9FUNG|nr:hypothetical protein HK097_007127 [Rhizophlyctis rosea]
MTDLYLYLLSLSYADPPDYDYIESLLQSLLDISGKSWDTPYDWESLQSDEDFTMATSSDVVGAAGLVTTRETIATGPFGGILGNDRAVVEDGERVFMSGNQEGGGMDRRELTVGGGAISRDAASEGEIVEPRVVGAGRHDADGGRSKQADVDAPAPTVPPFDLSMRSNSGKSLDDLRMLLQQLPDSLQLERMGGMIRKPNHLRYQRKCPYRRRPQAACFQDLRKESLSINQHSTFDGVVSDFLRHPTLALLEPLLATFM